MDEILKRQWHPVGFSRDLTEDKPIGSVVMGEDIVVWRAKDKLCAWKDLCPHRGTKLSLGKICNNRIRCAYHGWEFNSDGQCEHIPSDPNAKIPAKAKAVAIYQAQEYGGFVWVTLSDNPDPFPKLPLFDEQEFRIIPIGPFELHASFTRVIENFLDVSHAPILHDGYIGTVNHAEIADMTVEIIDDAGRFTYKDVPLYQPDADGTGGEAKTSYYQYGLLAPNVVYFAKNVGDRDSKEIFVDYFPIRVVDEYHSVAHFCAGYNYPIDVSYETIIDFHTTIIGQDKPIVESQRPYKVPMDMGVETLIKTDIPITRYRRYLQNIGMKWGIAQ